MNPYLAVAFQDLDLDRMILVCVSRPGTCENIPNGLCMNLEQHGDAIRRPEGDSGGRPLRVGRCL